MKFGPKEIKELNEYLRTGRNRKREFLGGGITFASDLTQPEPKREVVEIDLFNQFNKRNPRAEGGRIGFQRPLTTVGKTADIVNYLKELPDGASFYKPDVAKLLNLGVGVKRGKEYVDTSLLTKVINSRPELKNKNFKFLTKTDVTVNKINNFIETFVQENGREPTQGEIQKGARADPTKLRKYITEGLVKNVADTVFDIQAKGANYILNTEKPTIEGLEKIVGKGKAEKLLARIYINSLGSLKKKFSNIDEGRSVYANFDKDQIELIKNKVRRVPGFTEVYGREITDLISEAYPDPKDAAKKKAALKKVSMFKRFNKEVANKFGFNQVLDHPLSYDFITKTSQGADPSELIRVRPLPERVNTFKSFLESDLEDISKTLKKGYDQTAYNRYLDAKSIADDLGIAFPKMAKTGTITSAAAAKVGEKPLIGDAKQAAVVQNKFRKFVQNISNDPRIQRLGINLKELKDLAKLPKINIPAYNRAVKKFALQGGKFGVPFVIGAGGIDFLKKQGIGFDQEFEQTADLTGGQIVPKGLSTEGKIAAGAAASSLAAKPVRTLLGKTLNVLTPPLFALDLYDRSKAMQDTAKNITGMEPGMQQDRAVEDFAAGDYKGFAMAKGGRIGFDSGTIPGGYDDNAYAYLREIDDEIFNSFKKYKAGGGKMRYGQYAYNAKRQMFGPFGVGVGRLKRAGGGLLKQAGDRSGAPPERGPNPQGLPGLLKRVKNI